MARWYRRDPEWAANHPIGVVYEALRPAEAPPVHDADPQVRLRRPVRALLVLGAVAGAGFVLGTFGAGVGSAQGTDTTLTATTTAVVTTAVTTTATETTTTEHTTTSVQTTTVPPTTTTPATTSAETSSSSTPWGWIALGLGAAVALLIGFLIWQRNRAGAAAWSTKSASLNRRCLVALDNVLASGSVVTGQIEALAAEARALETSAPDDHSRASVSNVRARLEELAKALEADRTLRLGTPPPSEEQVSYSTALIRQQVEQLQGALHTPGTGPPSG